MEQEMVLIMGYPAGGKSTRASMYEDRGYVRLNRDERGGRVRALAPLAREALSVGRSVVLDNTFPTTESRRPFVRAAQSCGVPVKCEWMATRIEDAQFNACTRMVRRYGRLLGEGDYGRLKDPGMFPPAAQFSYRKRLQEPLASEGFSSVERVEFERAPLGPEYSGRALILDFDQTLRDVPHGSRYGYPTEPDEVRVLPNRAEVLKRYLFDGYMLLGASNQSGIAKGVIDEPTAKACFERTEDLLGVSIGYEYCPHKAPLVSCWCRKPMPGMGVLLIERDGLDPSKCIMVGDQRTDEEFARRCGFGYVPALDFFEDR